MIYFLRTAIHHCTIVTMSDSSFSLRLIQPVEYTLHVLALECGPQGAHFPRAELSLALPNIKVGGSNIWAGGQVGQIYGQGIGGQIVLSP